MNLKFFKKIKKPESAENTAFQEFKEGFFCQKKQKTFLFVTFV
jgi:hypothetical protein